MRKSIALIPLYAAVAAASPGALALAADKALTASGTIARVQATERAVTVTLPEGGQARFVWNADTKISGILTPGAKVTIRYEAGADGKNLALQITVARS